MADTPDTGDVKSVSFLDNTLHHTTDVVSGGVIAAAARSRIGIECAVYAYNDAGTRTWSGKITGSRGADNGGNALWGFELRVVTHTGLPIQGENTITVSVSNPDKTTNGTAVADPQPSDVP